MSATVTAPVPHPTPRSTLYARRPPQPRIADGFVVSHHAQERAEGMGVTLAEMEDTIRRFENRYQQPSYGEHRVMYQRGRLGISTNEEPGHPKVVVSVLWNEKDQWEREEPKP